MPGIKLTRQLAYAASQDAANRAMRSAGRKAWSEEDYNVAVSEFNRLWPLCKHGVDREDCAFCPAE